MQVKLSLARSIYIYKDWILSDWKPIPYCRLLSAHSQFGKADRSTYTGFVLRLFNPTNKALKTTISASMYYTEGLYVYFFTMTAFYSGPHSYNRRTKHSPVQVP